MATEASKPESAKAAEKAEAEQAAARREIPGNLPYTTASGTLKKILEKLITAERPTKFNYDFLDTVLGFSGGSAKTALSIMRRVGLIGADGSPTETYAKFKTDSGRSIATVAALKAGFPEIFKRNEHAHKANEQRLTDIVVEITGLTKTDPVARAIVATFAAIQSFIREGDVVAEESKQKNVPQDDTASDEGAGQLGAGRLDKLGIAYNINIVLPETSNVDVFNAIFKSLKENLLK